MEEKTQKPHPNQARNHRNMIKQVVPIFDKHTVKDEEGKDIITSRTLVATKDIWHEKEMNKPEYADTSTFWANLNRFPKESSLSQRIKSGELTFVPKEERDGTEVLGKYRKAA